MKLHFVFFLALLSSCNPYGNNQIVDSGFGDKDGSAPKIVVVDQTDDDNSSSGFGGGTHDGTIFSNGVLSLDSATNNAELNESWTPQWSNMVAYWKFENDWLDYFNVNNGVVGGNPSFVNNKRLGAKSADFDGNDYVVIPDHPSLNPANEITYGGWFYLRTLQAQDGLISKYEGGVPGQRSYDLTINGAGATALQVWMSSTGNVQGSLTTDVGLISANEWFHAMVTYKAGGKTRIYFNGKIVKEGNSWAPSLFDNSTPLYLSADFGAGRNIDGMMDEVAIWNKELSPEEIELIYSRQSAKFSGEMKSRIIDSKNDLSSWTNLEWMTTLPFGKELPSGEGVANSENSTDYSSLTTNSLMNGIVGLWHFNENSWTGVANQVIDSSGLDHHGQAFNSVSTRSFGQFNRSGFFDNINDYIDLNSNTSLRMTNDLTISVWFYPIKTSGDQQIIRTGLNTDSKYEMRVSNNNLLYEHYGSGWRAVTSAGVPILRNQFNHLLITRSSNGRDIAFYINGKSAGTANLAAPPDAGGAAVTRIGALSVGTRQVSGYIDELALWNRTLTQTEILELYRRGANRVKFQVRSCELYDCSDQDLTTGLGWRGPGGNYLTYFSELYNNSSVTSSCSIPQACFTSELNLSGDVLTSTPSLQFDAFGGDALSLDNNRYFQYKVILESDDEQKACSGGTTSCSPEVKSVTIGPEHTYQE